VTKLTLISIEVSKKTISEGEYELIKISREKT
jgi:hypothetical protein